MAEICGVSVATIKRAKKKYTLRLQDQFSNVTDDELVRLINDYAHDFPFWGEKMMLGHLRSRGINVPRSRLRQAMHVADEAGIHARKKRVLKRRVYSVNGPRDLWHMDGEEKLKRWNFYIHGCVDGYSRTVVYLRVADNKRSATVTSFFREAVERWGLPFRVRMDRGTENTGVADFMLSHPLRGAESKCVLAGPSVHNQRIERLWRDVFEGCISVFYYLFFQLEEEGLLVPDASTCLQALHYVYLHVIQHHLDQFTEAWNHHKLRTERNLSPLDLYSSACDSYEGYEEIMETGLLDEYNGRNSNVNSIRSNELESTSLNEISEELQRLMELVFPRDNLLSTDYLKSKYVSVSEFIIANQQ